MNGSNVKFMPSEKIVKFWPTSIALDIFNKTIYFLDATTDQLLSTDYDGIDNADEHYKPNLMKHATDFAIESGTLLWTDRRAGGLLQTPLYHQANSSSFVYKPRNRFVGHVAVITATNQPRFKSRCYHDNGTSFCQKDEFCIHLPKTEDSSEMNCWRPLSKSNNTFKCTDDSWWIPVSWKCDGQDDCTNGSDEVNCHEICKENQFLCKNETIALHCIPNSLLCDDHYDCADSSDEADCN